MQLDISRISMFAFIYGQTIQKKKYGTHFEMEGVVLHCAQIEKDLSVCRSLLQMCYGFVTVDTSIFSFCLGATNGHVSVQSFLKKSLQFAAETYHLNALSGS
jgi:low temperature requirement protein LtrA